MGNIQPLSIDTCLEFLAAKTESNPGGSMMWLSLGYWLKEARKWQIIKDHEPPQGLTPIQLEMWINAQVEDSRSTRPRTP